jgi:hypothetical protein
MWSGGNGPIERRRKVFNKNKMNLSLFFSKSSRAKKILPRFQTLYCLYELTDAGSFCLVQLSLPFTVNNFPVNRRNARKTIITPCQSARSYAPLL